MARRLCALPATAQRRRLGSGVLRGPPRKAHEARPVSGQPRRECPVCGATDRRVVFHQQFAAVEQATPVTGYDVAVCERCGAGYADGIPHQAAFDRYYRDMSTYEYAQRGGEESEYDSRRLALIADIVAPRVPASGARILDIG